MKVSEKMEGSVDTALKIDVDKKNERYSIDFQFKGNLKVENSDLIDLFIKNKGVQQLNRLN